MKEELENFMRIIGDVNNLISKMGITTRHNTGNRGLKNTIRQLDLIDDSELYQTTTAYTFFPSTHGTFSRTAHMLGHKLNLNRF